LPAGKPPPDRLLFAAMLMSELLESGGNFYGTTSRAHTLQPQGMRDDGLSAATTPSRFTTPADAASSSRRSQTSHKSLGEDGDTNHGLTATDSAALRCSAAISLSRIACSSLGKIFDNRVVTPESFHRMSMILIDEQFFARSTFLRVLRKKIAVGKLAFRYMALPMLVALEPKVPQRKLMKDAYPAIFDMYRRAGSGLQGVFSIMPEYILPFCIFLLAHDEERFPSSQAVTSYWKSRRSALESGDDAGDRKDDFGPLQVQALCLTYVCDALINSLPVSSGSSVCSSLSLMFAILRKIKDCDDAVNASRTYAVHAAADLAFLVLKRHAKESAAYAEYPGEIRLPASLFCAGAQPSAASKGTTLTKGVRSVSPRRMASVSTQSSSRPDGSVLQAASSTNSTIVAVSRKPEKTAIKAGNFETPAVKSAKARNPANIRVAGSLK
jgi:hypothetical protein